MDAVGALLLATFLPAFWLLLRVIVWAAEKFPESPDGCTF